MRSSYGSFHRYALHQKKKKKKRKEYRAERGDRNIYHIYKKQTVRQHGTKMEMSCFAADNFYLIRKAKAKHTTPIQMPHEIDRKTIN